MRRIHYLLGFLVVLESRALGYAHAPGTYPDEEMRDGGELEVPKNPYQSGWTGYEYYYEKEPKKMPPGSGKMPAFQSIESVSSDKESPDDPEVFTASGSEHDSRSSKKMTMTTTSSTSTTPAPTTTRAPEPEIEVVASSTTGTIPTTTTTTITVRSTTTTTSTPVTTTTVESETHTSSPTAGTDLSAPADDSEMYPGAGEKDDTTEPPQPKNLLTVLIEKNVRPRPPPSTFAPLSPESSYDSVADPVGYDLVTSRRPSPTSTTPEAKLNSGDSSYDDLGGPSGYENVSFTSQKKQSTTTTSTASPVVDPYDTVVASHSAPGYVPKIEIKVTTETPRKVEYSSVPDYGQGSITDSHPGKATTVSEPSGYELAHSSDSRNDKNSSTPKATPEPQDNYSDSYSTSPSGTPLYIAPKKQSTTSTTPSDEVDPYDLTGTSHYAPGHIPRVETKVTTEIPRKVEYPSEPDYGQGSITDSHSGKATTVSEPFGNGLAQSTDSKNDKSSSTSKATPESQDSYSDSYSTSTSGTPLYVAPKKQSTENPRNVGYPSGPDYGQGSTNDGVPGREGNILEPSGNVFTASEGPHDPSYYEGDSTSANGTPRTYPTSERIPTPNRDQHGLKFTPSSLSEPGFNPYPPPKVYHGSTSDPSSQSETEYYDDNSYDNSKPRSHVGTVNSSKFSPEVPKDPPTFNSNNAISPRDPFDHFGTVTRHIHAPSTGFPSPPLAPPTHFSRRNGDFEDEQDSGYELNGVVAPERSHTTTNTISGSYTDVKAQISEIDRIAEAFENSAREPVEYDRKITSESSKRITVEAGKEISKHYGRKSRKCCSCCDEKQPVSRQIESKVDPTNGQQMVDAGHSLEEEPVQNYVPLENTVGGSAYVQKPVQQPYVSQPSAVPQQTHYQQPFQQYQPQYPQSYPYQQPSGCGCQPLPQNCCAPPAPCCLPTIPCCPPIPCCPQPKICCQPQPVCLPPPTCCQLNFQLPTIPICGRACPSCPCRRRVHKSHRMKRHAISGNCNRCSAAGEPWKALIHHREKRAAPGCSSGFSTMQQSSCGTCGASNLRSPRVKRMGCLPCLGRKKRDTSENSHIRVKRMGCLPCLGRKKRSALSSCSQCNSLGHLFNRYKRSLFGCSPCAPPQPCGCQGRKKRSVTMKVVKRAPVRGAEQCDATCCDYSKCQNRQKKETLVPFM